MQIQRINNKQYQLLSNELAQTEKYTLIVRKDFVFDGATIPKALWSIIGSPFTGAYTNAALFHDALYQSQILSRKESDDIFLELMKQGGVSYFDRYAMYLGVRIGGSLAWSSNIVSNKYLHIEERNIL